MLTEMIIFTVSTWGNIRHSLMEKPVPLLDEIYKILYQVCFPYEEDYWMDWPKHCGNKKTHPKKENKFINENDFWKLYIIARALILFKYSEMYIVCQGRQSNKQYKMAHYTIWIFKKVNLIKISLLYYSFLNAMERFTRLKTHKQI